MVAEAGNKIEKLKVELQEALEFVNSSNNVIPMVENVLKLYSSTDDAEKKNLLLKSIVIKAEYLKSKEQKSSNFSLNVYTKF
jgi:site-specific DNA recombinase